MAKPDKKPAPEPTPTPTPVPVPLTPVEFEPAALPPLTPVPGVPVATGECARRCSGCNRLSRWPQAFVEQNRGRAVLCPNCGAAGTL